MMPIPKDKLDTIFRDPEFRALPNDRKDVLLSKIESSYTSPTQLSDAEPPEQAAPTKKKSLDIPEKIQQITGAPIKTALDVAKTVGGVYDAVKKPVVDLAVKTGPGLQLLSRIPEVNLESPLAQFTPQPIREAIFPKVPITGPKAAQAVGGLGFDTAAIPGIGGAAKGTARVAKGVINKVQGISEYVGMPLSRSLERIVKTGVMKGVKPTIAGKGTAPKFKAYLDDSRKAVGTIYDNRNSLGLLDEAGQPVKKLPENLQEFSQAIHNTKETVFKKYDALAKQATGQGAEVDLVPLGQDILDNLVKREKVLKAVAPEAIEYAQKRAASLIEAGALNADEAQDAVKTLNNSLEAYYRNPSYETGSKATVDAGIASALRKQLDSVIEKATGSQYQALRSAYKSLLTVEKDVARQAIIQGRRAGKGLLDFSDIFSGADVVQGLLRLDPTQVARGAAVKGIAQAYKKLNSPDRAVKMMFKNYDKIYRATLSRAKTVERAMSKAPITGVIQAKQPSKVIPTVKKETPMRSSSIQQAKASGQSFDEWVKGQQPEKVTFKSSKANKDYIGGHEAPMAEDINAPIWDLTGKYTGNNLYPDDIYSFDSARLYSSGMDYDNQAISILKSLKDRPNAPVTVYRAVPKDSKGEINAGDWVTLVKNYAKDHGESNLGGKYKIIKKEVRARDIFTDANSIQEFGYDPQPALRPKDMPYDILSRTMDKPNTTTGSYRSQLKAEWDKVSSAKAKLK